MPMHHTRDEQGVLPVPLPLRAAIQARIQGELTLPLLSDTAARVVAASRDEHADLQRLASLVAHDQSLAAHLLRVANSAGHAPREPILSVQQALGRLGITAVSEIVIAIALKERVFTVRGHQPRLRELWLHSAVTASYARELAQLLRRNLESAFLCGLLHDVGMPIAMQIVCDLEHEEVAQDVTVEAMEGAMSEFHAELGARMARHWRLGPWIDMVIQHHHAPTSAKFLQDEVALIALADLLADWAADASMGVSDFPADTQEVASLCIAPADLVLLLHKRERVLRLAAAFQ